MTRDDLVADAKAVLDVLRGGGQLTAERTFPHPHKHTRSAKNDPTHRVPVTASVVSDLVTAGCLTATPVGRGTGLERFDRLAYALTEKGRQLAAG
jgi:hypothetical protein